MFIKCTVFFCKITSQFLTLVRKIIKNNNPFFFFLFPLSLRSFSLIKSVSNARDKKPDQGFPRREEFIFLSPQKDARFRTSRNQFEGSISEEHAFRSSGLGHRKLSGLSSLSGEIRRRLSRYMWKLYDRILELRILERVWFNYLKIFATNVIEILSIINII